MPWPVPCLRPANGWLSGRLSGPTGESLGVGLGYFGEQASQAVGLRAESMLPRKVISEKRSHFVVDLNQSSPQTSLKIISAHQSKVASGHRPIPAPAACTMPSGNDAGYERLYPDSLDMCTSPVPAVMVQFGRGRSRQPSETLGRRSRSQLTSETAPGC